MLLVAFVALMYAVWVVQFAGRVVWLWMGSRCTQLRGRDNAEACSGAKEEEARARNLLRYGVNSSWMFRVVELEALRRALSRGDRTASKLCVDYDYTPTPERIARIVPA